MPIVSTLWNNQGTSDKVYQIVTSRHTDENDERWDVYALYGKRRSTLRVDIKAERISFEVARTLHRNLEDSKKARGYRDARNLVPEPADDFLRRYRAEQQARVQVNPNPAPPPPVARPPQAVQGQGAEVAAQMGRVAPQIPEPPALVQPIRRAENYREVLLTIPLLANLPDTNWPLNENGEMPARLDIHGPKLVPVKGKMPLGDMPNKRDYQLVKDWWNINYYACVNGKVRAWDLFGNPTILKREQFDTLKEIEEKTGPIAFIGQFFAPTLLNPRICRTAVSRFYVLGGKDMSGVTLNALMAVMPNVENIFTQCMPPNKTNGGTAKPVHIMHPRNVRMDWKWKSMDVRSAARNPNAALLVTDHFGEPILVRPPQEGRELQKTP